MEAADAQLWRLSGHCSGGPPEIQTWLILASLTAGISAITDLLDCSVRKAAFDLTVMKYDVCWGLESFKLNPNGEKVLVSRHVLRINREHIAEVPLYITDVQRWKALCIVGQEGFHHLGYLPPA